MKLLTVNCVRKKELHEKKHGHGWPILMVLELQVICTEVIFLSDFCGTKYKNRKKQQSRTKMHEVVVHSHIFGKE